ncbi:hypothetical protein ACR6C2_08145 [Streptomyces sp. INA 01156]
MRGRHEGEAGREGQAEAAVPLFDEEARPASRPAWAEGIWYTPAAMARVPSVPVKRATFASSIARRLNLSAPMRSPAGTVG